MYGIIVTGHGRFAEGLLSSVELILGKQEYLKGVEFKKDDSPEILMRNLRNEVKLMDELYGVIFLTDLVGGTPFNTSVLLSQKLDNCRVLVGTNLPLLIEIIMNRELKDIDEVVNIGLSTGKDSIFIYKKIEDKYKNNIKQNGI